MNDDDSFDTSETKYSKSMGLLILLENEEFQITIPINLFLQYQNEYMIKNNVLDDVIYKLISEEYQKGNIIIDASLLCEGKRCERDLIYRTADLLEESKCIIQRKTNLEFVSKFEVETFITGTSKEFRNSGWGGRRFSIDGNVFLEITDWYA